MEKINNDPDFEQNSVDPFDSSQSIEIWNFILFMQFYWHDRIYKIMQNARIFFFAVVEEVSW